ncbi:MAG TPA: hypothetical protein ENN44_06085 [Methanoculleus sp.]|nr:hypothetical protein [Methanoculleus sp.]
MNEDDAAPVEVALSHIHAISATGTADGTPSITMSASSPDGKRGRMLLLFIGGGGIPPHDERDRIRHAIGGAVAAARTEPPVAAIPAAKESGLISGQGIPSRGTRILLSADHILVRENEYTSELTRDQIILISGNTPDDPPLTVSRDAISGGVAESTPAGDPVLRLKVRTPGGLERSMVLVFSEWYEGARGPERDRWLEVLRGGAVSAASAKGPGLPPCMDGDRRHL